jgi:hypothetical protein
MFIGSEIKILMAFFREQATEVRPAKRRDSLAVSRRDLVARPRAAEASQWAGPTRLVVFPAERLAD